MTCQIQAAGSIELYFYGELSTADHAHVQSHVKHCVVCRQALQDLSLIRAALASRPDVATPPGGDWSNFMNRLNTSVREEPFQRVVDLHAGPAGSSDRSARVPRMFRRHRFAGYAAIAALVTLVTISVLMVSRQREAVQAPDLVTAETPVSSPIASTSVRIDPALVSLSGSHFERSKLVLLGLATKDAESLEADDWSRDRELAAALLNDTRVYRIAAEERGMNGLAGVMRDLELVLLQTAMSEAPDAVSLEKLQRLIRRRDLLTKMDVVTTGGP